jgi:GT2 family glycosyltransferase
MSVAVITVNWNKCEMTLACVGALQSGSLRPDEVYIVDNASTDGSLDHFERLPDGVTLIANPVNAGWAGGNNAGVKRALADGHDFIFLLNNDAILDPHALETLADIYPPAGESVLLPVFGVPERLSNGTFGFVTAEVSEDTGVPHWFHGGAELKLFEALTPTSYVHGAALFTHRSVFERVGGFDERFFLCFDDTDWSCRARRMGHSLLVARDAAITHDGSASMGGFASPLTIYFMTRNRLLFAEKHCTLPQRQALGRSYDSYLRENASKHGERAVAFRRGVDDYLARRFGDCPQEIRTLAQTVPAAEASV